MFNGAISMLDVGVVMQVKESDDKGGPLEADHGAEHVEGHGAQPVLFQEGHEEAKTDEYHNMNILEHWKKKEEIRRANDRLFYDWSFKLNVSGKYTLKSKKYG